MEGNQLVHNQETNPFRFSRSLVAQQLQKDLQMELLTGLKRLLRLATVTHHLRLVLIVET